MEGINVLSKKSEKESFSLKGGKKFYIFPISDLHVGNPSWNSEYFKFWQELWKKTRTKNKVVYLLGDLIDVSSTRIGTWEWDMRVDEQLTTIKHLLKPCRKYVRFMVSGNHDSRPKKDYNLDLSKIMAEELNVPYHPDDFYDKLYIEDKCLTVYGKHGTKFSSKKNLAEKAFIEDMESNPDGDLCMQGHNHYTSFFSKPYRTSNNLIRRRYFAFTGNYINYFGSYARSKGMNLTPEGFLRITVNKDLKLEGEEYHIDRERPDLMNLNNLKQLKT